MKPTRVTNACLQRNSDCSVRFYTLLSSNFRSKYRKLVTPIPVHVEIVDRSKIIMNFSAILERDSIFKLNLEKYCVFVPRIFLQVHTYIVCILTRTI